MKSGEYSMRFACDGYQSLGSLSLDGAYAKGGDDRYEVEGQIAEAGQRLVASFTIDLAPGVSGNSRIKGIFACPMTGTFENDRFSLYGLGPLGLIIEINCQWSGPIQERAMERRRKDD